VISAALHPLSAAHNATTDKRVVWSRRPGSRLSVSVTAKERRAKRILLRSTLQDYGAHGSSDYSSGFRAMTRYVTVFERRVLPSRMYSA